MSLGNILYSVLIGPLQLLFEVIFSYANKITGHPGLTIISLSLSMNFLILPLYMRADALQEEERDMELKLAKGVEHIKKTFKGDERMMMLQTYYRQNNYKPTYVLKGAMSLFLEIPFFIAAYRFLSTLPILEGVKFGPIADLGRPDHLIVIGSLAINLLPIVMTLINAVSTAIFTKGYPTKTKVQLYGMALFFLVFLYDSPAGLVFYWTLNNLFSLIKTIFYKLSNPKKVLCILASLVGVASLVFACVLGKSVGNKFVFFLALGLLLQLPLIVMIVKGRKWLEKYKGRENIIPNSKLFVSSALLLTVLTGMLIPINVISSSPLEFVNMSAYYNPLWYVLSSVCMAAGTFLVWINVFYKLSKDSGKIIIERFLLIFSIIALTDYMFFGKNLGTLLPSLQYENAMQFSGKEIAVNLLIVILVAFIIYIFANKKKIPEIIIIGVLAIAVMAGKNVLSVKSIVNEAYNKSVENEEMPKITLSKNGNNVVVIMLDRAMGEYIPYIMTEYPELEERYAGFTYFSHTLSYGGHTNFASPALFGGYEYTPEKINQRKEEALVDKQNEALKVMPVMFAENGYDVTVFDPPYAGYSWIPDLSIYNDYAGIKAYNTNGVFTDESVNLAQIESKKRNFFCYGLAKSLPLAMQKSFYEEGNYHSLQTVSYSAQTVDGSLLRANGLNENFLNAYAVLENMTDMTELLNDSSNHFLMMGNDTTHEPMLLQKNGFVPKSYVDNTEYPDEDKSADSEFAGYCDKKLVVTGYENQLTQYHSTVAALTKLGDWFDYLRDNDLYDNTRIILVSDHGHGLEQIAEYERYFTLEEGTDLEFYYPLLMEKDFDANDFTVSDEFMTNADTPVLASDKLIDNPINPFTGQSINSDKKNESFQYVFESDKWEIPDNNGNQFKSGRWYAVYTEDILNQYCWNIVKENDVLPID